jgi:hypothetical protein
MPEWRLLPEPDRKAVIAYFKTFSDRWEEEEKVAPVVLGPDPFQEFPKDGILHGEVVYHTVATCWSCHPAYASEDTMRELYPYYEAAQLSPPSAFRDNIFKSIVTKTRDGEELYPPDFTWDNIKTGEELEQIALRIATGITGSAMPTWAGILPERDIWGMAYYVQYLAQEHREFPRSPDKLQPFGEMHPYGVDPILFPPEEGEEYADEEYYDDEAGDEDVASDDANEADAEAAQEGE